LTVTWRESAEKEHPSGWNKQQEKTMEMQFKIMDKNVCLFAPGTSAAVLWSWQFDMKQWTVILVNNSIPQVKWVS